MKGVSWEAGFVLAIITVMFLFVSLYSSMQGSPWASNTFILFAVFSAIATAGALLYGKLLRTGMMFGFFGAISIIVAGIVLYLQAEIPSYFLGVMVVTLASSVALVYLVPQNKIRLKKNR